jgi:hypothetical protein
VLVQRHRTVVGQPNDGRTDDKSMGTNTENTVIGIETETETV